MKVLGLIPVRGGSKGIPRKNEKSLHGKPLLQYTVESALASQMLSTTIVSTEDDQLFKLSLELGVSAPFKRPHYLAMDTSSSVDVVIHAIKALEEMGEEFDAVCLLQATNPFRKPGMIDNAIDAFKESGADSLVSVLPVPHEYNPHWVFEPNDHGYLIIATGETEIIKRRQELPPAFIRDGAIYLTKTEVLLKKKSLYGDSTSYILSDIERHVNIDTIEDWKAAEDLAKRIFG